MTAELTRMDEVMVLMAEINKKHGEGTVVLASEVSEAVPRITSGSPGLDLILGGGWPANQWVEIVGNESSGKTALALKTVAANQRRDPDFSTAWIAAEKWVSQYAEMCGVDLSRVIVVETNDMEEAYDHAILLAESRLIDCIVIDSLPALVPAAEDKKDMDGITVGRGAILTAQFFRKVGKATKRNLNGEEKPVLGIMINQWRMKIGITYGDSRTTPGGVAKDYAYFVRVEVRRGDWIETKSTKERIGQTLVVRTMKNKTAPAQKNAHVDFYFELGGPVDPGQYDIAKDVIGVALQTGAIQQGGGGYYKFGEEKWRGRDSLVDAIRGNTGLYDQIRAEVDFILTAAPK